MKKKNHSHIGKKALKPSLLWIFRTIFLAKPLEVIKQLCMNVL